MKCVVCNKFHNRGLVGVSLVRNGFVDGTPTPRYDIYCSVPCYQDYLDDKNGRPRRSEAVENSDAVSEPVAREPGCDDDIGEDDSPPWEPEEPINW